MPNNLLDRSRDNLINKYNKQIERVAKSLGTASRLYQSLASQLSAAFPNKFIKRVTTKEATFIQISRSYELNNLPQYVFDNLEKRYKSDALSAEKAYLRQNITAKRFLTGEKLTKGISKAEYQEMAKFINQAGHDFDTALKYLYEHETSVQYKMATVILGAKGKKSYETLTRVIDLAIDLATELASIPYVSITPPTAMQDLMNREQSYDIWRRQVNPYYQHAGDIGTPYTL